MKKTADFLSKSEKQIVLDCLYAATDGPFFPDWEFGSLIGASRDEVRACAKRLKENTKIADDSWITTNTLNNLLGYPHAEFERWQEHFDFSKQDLETILNKLLYITKYH